MFNKKRILAAGLCVLILVCSIFALTACSKEEFKLTFMVGETQHDQVLSSGKATITLPTQPSKDGYEFGGWYFEKDFTTPFTADYFADKELDKNYLLYAKMDLIQYTVAFENTMTAVMPDLTYTVERAPYLANPSVAGYQFDGWYDGDTRVTSFAKGTIGDYTLTARWSLISYTITYAGTKDATNTNPTRFNIETEDIVLAPLTKENYTFKGWYDGEIKCNYIGKGAYSKNITLTARWEPLSFDIHYENVPNDVENPNKTSYTIEDDKIDLIDLSQPFHTFLGWFDGETEVTSIPKGSFGEKTFTAKWSDMTSENNADGTCTITGYGGEAPNLVLPNEIRGKVVSAIAPAVFKNKTFITSVTLPTGLKVVGDNAFEGCTALSSIVFPEGLLQIGIYSFSRCAVTSVVIPNSVTTLMQYSFAKCKSLTTVTLSTALTRIGFYAFTECEALTAIEIPDNVTVIESNTFNSCHSLASVKFGANLTTIEKEAFKFCTALSSIILPTTLTKIEDDAFVYCYRLLEIYNLSALTLNIAADTNGRVAQYAKIIKTVNDNFSVIEKDANGLLFYSAENQIILFGYVGTSKNIVVPEYYKDAPYTIAERVFYYNLVVESVVFPNNVTVIPANTFENCETLKSVTIPASVTRFEEDAFKGCKNLKEVHFKGTLSQWCAMNFVTSTITLANSNPLYAGADLYIGASDQKFTEFNATMQTTIAPRVFFGCTSLTSMTFSSTLVSIGENAFRGCQNLKTVYFNSTFINWCNLPFANEYSNPLSNGATALYIQNVLFESFTPYPGMTTTSKYMFYGYVGLKSVSFEGLTSLGEYSFARCDGLTSVAIPATIKTVGAYCFYRCASLKIVDFNEGLEAFEEHAFDSCANLTGSTERFDCIFLPASLMRIERYVFTNCTNLKKAKFRNEKNWVRYSLANVRSPVTTFSVETTMGTYLRTSYDDYRWVIEIPPEN